MLIHKYELRVNIPLVINGGFNHCASMIRDHFQSIIRDEPRFFESLVQMFIKHYLPFSKYIGVSLLGGRIKQNIYEARGCMYFPVFEIDQKWKDYIVSHLSQYYDPVLSVNNIYIFAGDVSTLAGGGLFNPSEVLKGERTVYAFRNGINTIMLAECTYDSVTGERVYDASAFLEKLVE